MSLASAPIGERDFAAVRDFVYREIGIALTDAKKALVASRLGARVRALGFTTYRGYVERAVADPEERQRLIDAITTNETRFFREPAQFELLTREIFPMWTSEADEGSRRRTTRIWSAGCSSGEEPYTLAMLLAEHLPAAEGWSHEILATDISSRVLERAERGIYPLARKDEVPEGFQKRYLLRGVRSQEGSFAVAPSVRRFIHFSQLNLNDDSRYPTGAFDAIFCRNVLIYFDVESRRRVIDGLLARLAPGGLLFLGHAETLNGRSGIRPLAPHVYGLPHD